MRTDWCNNRKKHDCLSYDGDVPDLLPGTPLPPLLDRSKKCKVECVPEIDGQLPKVEEQFQQTTAIEEAHLQNGAPCFTLKNSSALLVKVIMARPTERIQ